MPAIRSLSATAEGLTIVCSGGTVVTLLKADVLDYWQHQAKGNAAQKKAETIEWAKAQIEAQAPSVLTAAIEEFDFDDLDGHFTNLVIGEGD